MAAPFNLEAILYNRSVRRGRGYSSPPGRQRSRMSLMSSAALSAKAGWPAARRARSRARS
ncbi:MAG: hypothetical protein MZV64_63895 [Ignavibacteriales bacterium]|nr:hypothetical protein [Ignavibacteriales bacterium]